MTIRISENEESRTHGGDVGMFVIRAIEPNGTMTENILLNANSKYYEPGTVHTIVLPADIVGKPKAVKITWEHETIIIDPLTWRFEPSRIYIESLTIDSLESGQG